MQRGNLKNRIDNLKVKLANAKHGEKMSITLKIRSAQKELEDFDKKYPNIPLSQSRKRRREDENENNNENLAENLNNKLDEVENDEILDENNNDNINSENKELEIDINTDINTFLNENDGLDPPPTKKQKMITNKEYIEFLELKLAAARGQLARAPELQKALQSKTTTLHEKVELETLKKVLKFPHTFSFEGNNANEDALEHRRLMSNWIKLGKMYEGWNESAALTGLKDSLVKTAASMMNEQDALFYKTIELFLKWYDNAFKIGDARTELFDKINDNWIIAENENIKNIIPKFNAKYSLLDMTDLYVADSIKLRTQLQEHQKVDIIVNALPDNIKFEYDRITKEKGSLPNKLVELGEILDSIDVGLRLVQYNHKTQKDPTNIGSVNAMYGYYDGGYYNNRYNQFRGYNNRGYRSPRGYNSARSRIFRGGYNQSFRGYRGRPRNGYRSRTRRSRAMRNRGNGRRYNNRRYSNFDSYDSYSDESKRQEKFKELPVKRQEVAMTKEMSNKIKYRPIGYFNGICDICNEAGHTARHCKELQNKDMVKLREKYINYYNKINNNDTSTYVKLSSINLTQKQSKEKTKKQTKNKDNNKTKTKNESDSENNKTDESDLEPFDSN